CKGISVQSGALGGATNASKYYLYLDTDGTTTGGCAAQDNTSLTGFEYLFKYTNSFDTTTGKIKETLLSQQCTSSAWVPSGVPFKVDKAKACTFIGGPIMGIDKAVFSGKADVNTSKGWRAYAVTAAVGGNASNITDRIGPGSGDFKGIDVDLVDCTSTADKDNAQCTKYKKFGFFPGEFGPACVDNVDNDGDGLTDCNDFDCVYDPFFCSGSFTAISDDGSSPSIVWSKINTRVPTALTFIFDTDEPSNGSVKYYYNDTACQTLNTTLLDPSLTDGDAHTDYRPHHAIDLAGLSANTTYFYKFKSCDPSGNCAVSKCSNSTTAAAHTNITFKLDI
ncbi:MAG: hypothetical protein QF535_01535, partial [Anaerolineales bacterium]|nr:hypothetical protein [Anaerolineales bacterium]